jgi:hypothetical protein
MYGYPIPSNRDVAMLYQDAGKLADLPPRPSACCRRRTVRGWRQSLHPTEHLIDRVACLQHDYLHVISSPAQNVTAAAASLRSDSAMLSCYKITANTPQTTLVQSLSFSTCNMS